MAGKAILVIDSDTEAAQRIESALEAEDYLVFIASTEEFGITMARKVHPALIFVNPAMTGGSGLDVCRTFHEIETLGNVPVIVLSPFEGEMDPRYHSEYGIVDVLGKSFTTEELVAKTERAILLKAPDATPPAAEEPGSEEGAGGREEEKTLETAQEAPWEEPAVPEEPLKTGEVTEKEDDTPLTPKKAVRRRRAAGSKPSVPVIAAAILVILAAAGFIVYSMGLIGGKQVKKAVVSKTPPPAQQKPAEAVPAQKPGQGATQEKPAAPAAQPVPAPVQAAKPEAKPAGKAVYSVQIGAFKNEKNAEAVVKQFKEKGYEAFVQTVPKDKEMLHRVLIGKFENRKEAWKLAGEIGDKENVKAVVIGD